MGSRKKSIGSDKDFYEAARRLLLQTIDMFWVDHLEAMDYLRGSVNLRAYGQRDPLVEYKKEGLMLFKQMTISIDNEVGKLLPHLGEGAFVSEEKKLKEVRDQTALITGGKGRSVKGGLNRVGRNDPCPCGSGKKYKRCHGA